MEDTFFILELCKKYRKIFWTSKRVAIKSLRYKLVFNEHVFTKEGMLTCAKNSSVTETTSDMQGNITFAMTPDILKMSNICVKNEVVTYKQVNWFKCIYSHLEENFVYLCAHCFLRKKRKLRIFFNTFKRLIAQ